MPFDSSPVVPVEATILDRAEFTAWLAARRGMQWACNIMPGNGPRMLNCAIAVYLQEKTGRDYAVTPAFAIRWTPGGSEGDGLALPSWAAQFIKKFDTEMPHTGRGALAILESIP